MQVCILTNVRQREKFLNHRVKNTIMASEDLFVRIRNRYVVKFLPKINTLQVEHAITYSIDKSSMFSPEG